MANQSVYDRCLAFSDIVTSLSLQCCGNTTLYAADPYIAYCLTCAERHQLPPNTSPLLEDLSKLSEHIANAHIFICTVCVEKLSLTSHRSESQVRIHLQMCRDKLLEYQARPYFCTACLTTMWLKRKAQK